MGCTSNKPWIIIRGLSYSLYRQKFSLCCDLFYHEPVNPRFIFGATQNKEVTVFTRTTECFE